MNLRRACLALATVFAIGGLGNSSCQAGYEYFTSFGPFQNRLNALNYNQRENILFNNSGLQLGPAPTVTGQTNQTNFIFEFSSLDTPVENLTANGGQATISATDGAVNTMEIQPANGLVIFQAMAFNVDFLAANNNSLLIQVYNDFNSSTTPASSQTFTGQRDGFFGVIATGTDAITRIVLKAPSNSATDNLVQLEQVRVTNARLVPEPSSVLLSAIGLVGLFGYGARRRLSRRNG